MTDILTKELLNKRKDEARKEEIRQNMKSHCTKIRDGIRENGATSGERAIWELFQNARDLSDSAEIKITLTDKEFIFAHKGKPFTYDSLCSLVKQVSSQEKENDNSVGQYGTGFLTTHTFGRNITINGSMLINEDPKVYVDISNFEINRENFNNIPQFINDITNQIEAVGKLMDTQQKNTPHEWTELHYKIGNRYDVVLRAIEEAIKLMPYVLTFNDHIGKCSILYNDQIIKFSKEDKETDITELKCKQIIKNIGSIQEEIDCFYLELHGGESRVLLPLRSKDQVYEFGEIPRFFVHFPLIGANHFNVNFLFHSHRFTPEEKRDNIIIPKENDATEAIANANKAILDEMTQYLWNYLEKHIDTWRNTILMASINIKDSGFTEKKTEDFYKNIKEAWVEKFQKLKLIEIDGQRYSMSDPNHPVMLEPSLEQFLTDDKDNDFLSTIYPYAKGVGLVPSQEEILQWSRIINAWNNNKSENFLTLEDIVKHVSSNKGDNLFDILKMLVVADQTTFFEKYELIPNREGVLKKRDDLRDAKAITETLYDLVKNVSTDICQKMVDTDYQDIIKLTTYNRQNLREELNDIVKAKENEYWKDSDNKRPYDEKFEKSIINLCSAFTIQNGESKRNKLMPIICRFENISEYQEIYIPAADDDQSGFDLYRQVFLSLVENQMMKIEQKDKEWVANNMSDLINFVDYARGDDYKNFCTQYAIYPDMNGCLHVPEDLKKNNNVDERLFDLYYKVLGEDLRSKCVDKEFEGFFNKYYVNSYQFTSSNVAKEIQNKLSENQYQDVILLDIIDLTELEGVKGDEWRNLFKDIYDQRESIRYKLGTDEERKAVNRILKRKNPNLLTKIADVAERADADYLLITINQTIEAHEREQYIKKLGMFVESNVQQFIQDALKDSGISLKNEQQGQDLILSKDGFDDYFIEIKSRWKNKEQAIMSTLQFEKAVENPNRYALISAKMWDFNKQRALDDDKLTIEEMNPLLRVCDNIGTLEKDLKERVDAAFRGEEDEIRINGNYDVRVPQKVFLLTFDELIKVIKSKFNV